METRLDSRLFVVLALVVHQFVLHLFSDPDPDPRLKDDVHGGDSTPTDVRTIPEEIVPAPAPAKPGRKRLKRPAAAMESAADGDDSKSVPTDVQTIPEEIVPAPAPATAKPGRKRLKRPAAAMESAAAVADEHHDESGHACDDTQKVVDDDDPQSESEGPQDGSSSTANTSSLSSPSTVSETGLAEGEAQEMQEEELPSAFDEIIENLFDLSSFEADNGGIAGAQRTSSSSEIGSLADVFGCADRYVDRLQNYFGMEKIDQLIENLSGCNVLTFYSGLGGAELSIMQLYYSLCRWAEVHDRAPPDKPNFVIACDIDASCQRVLLSHKDI